MGVTGVAQKVDMTTIYRKEAPDENLEPLNFPAEPAIFCEEPANFRKEPAIFSAEPPHG
jgi:hypothetical protein